MYRNHNPVVIQAGANLFRPHKKGPVCRIAITLDQMAKFRLFGIPNNGIMKAETIDGNSTYDVKVRIL